MIEFSEISFIPVMQYSEDGFDIRLLTDESHCLWYLYFNGRAVQCAGCQHGLDLFDGCIEMARERRVLN